MNCNNNFAVIREKTTLQLEKYTIIWAQILPFSRDMLFSHGKIFKYYY